ncbi:hypothetical protein BSKO_12976 [Bryopsis sp. KO-2023]|nr:hypothetical protein BSKO_12976 [Bryopsis sp. KO-2023]
MAELAFRLLCVCFSALFISATCAPLHTVVERTKSESCFVDERIDCGYYGINQGECEGKGCCWVPGRGPWCFFPVDASTSANAGYVLENFNDTDLGYSGTLKLKEDSVVSSFGEDLSELALSVDFETESRTHVKIGDVDGERYEVPEKLLPRPDVVEKFPESDRGYKVEYTEDPFGFSIVRKSNKEVLFNTSEHRFIFKDQYIEITSTIPEDAALYGLGESTKSGGLRLKRDGRTITLWNRDQPSSSPDINLYGSHPILYDVRKDGTTDGVFLLNSNGMDIILNKDTITYRVTGGILDFYFFLGPDPNSVLKQYQEVIGKPVMPPFWSLGFHQCRYGYENMEEVQGVVDGYAKAKIPLEVVWGDIDYMDGYRDFTLEKQKYSLPKVTAFLKKLKSKGQKWVPIVDPGIKIDRGYPAYDNGLKTDVFLKDSTGKPYIGVVWPGNLHFVDYWHPDAQEYWTNQLRYFHDELAAFDGLWIDMNEPANFCSAPHLSRFSNEELRNGCPDISVDDKLERPPYAINNGNSGKPLSDRTVPVSIKHFDGTPHYDSHNLFGLAESITTYNSVADITGKRPFILSRSTFPGSGSFVAHWSGDNSADWNNLRWGTVSVLNSNLFGIPFAGADICGFNGVTNPELCARWISVGAFYPFSRDHSNHSPQELYLWPEVEKSAKIALKLRYQLLPYLYTTFYNAHIFGGAVAKPLWMDFPEEEETLNIDDQFMFGDSLLVSPAVEQGASQVEAYFPGGQWFSFEDGAPVVGPTTETLAAPLGTIPIHIRAGKIVPTQRYHLTTEEVRKSPFTLTVALDELDFPSAKGDLYVDDGENLKVDGEGSVYLTFEAELTSEGGVIRASNNSEGDLGDVVVEEVVLFGPACVEGMSDVMLKGESVGKDQVEMSEGSVRISGLDAKLAEGVLLTWVCIDVEISS